MSVVSVSLKYLLNFYNVLLLYWVENQPTVGRSAFSSANMVFTVGGLRKLEPSCLKRVGMILDSPVVIKPCI